MTHRLPEAAISLARWLAEAAAGDDHGGGDEFHAAEDAHGDGNGGDGHGEFGVHISYHDLYNAILFLVCIYVGGRIASFITMPALVGEIIVGILLGPPLANFVPNPPAWVLLGEIGLVLLVLEAGIDIDVATLKLIGTRGFLIALVGSILPIGIGIALAIAMYGTSDIKAAIAAGATFGPTSLGIALNILRSGGILNTPVGQLIISAAVIDDMIALIVLSMLESLVGTLTVAGLLVPIISALGFLIIGGYIALFWVPVLMERYCLIKIQPENQGKFAMAVMFALLLLLMPATYYAKASYLMGAFIAGLSFCTNHDVHVQFVRQFKRLLQWLMRIFFAASIGFQVPIKDFGQGHVLWQGLVFTAALLGKLAVGFMVPNFTPAKSFTGIHLRDCLMTGFSMAAEGEFAFVIAVYSVDNGLINKDLYASVVLAVLISTIIPPFCLRFTISYYNKRAEAALQDLAKDEMERQHDLEHDASLHDAAAKLDGAVGEPSSTLRPTKSQRQDELLHQVLRDKTAVFLCIQTQSEGRWGLMHQIMAAMSKLGLEIIDHRAWHPRGIHATLVNEIYAKDVLEIPKRGEANTALQERMQVIQDALSKAINQPESSKIKVQRWFPGVVEEIIETASDTGVSHDKHKKKTKTTVNLEERLLTEAAAALDKRQSVQTHATKEKTVEEILAGMQGNIVPTATEVDQKDTTTPTETGAAGGGAVDGMIPPASGGDGGAAPQKRPRRRRQKMRSTPVVGGGLFGETSNEEKTDVDHRFDGGGGAAAATGGRASRPSKRAAEEWKLGSDFGSHGTRAEIIVNGESYNVRIDNTTLKSLQTGFSGDMLDSRGMSVTSSGGAGMSIQPDSSDVTGMLRGYVRNAPLSKIVEDADDESDTASAKGAQKVETTKKGDPEDELPPV